MSGRPSRPRTATGAVFPHAAAFAVAARVIPAAADLADRPARLVAPGARADLAAAGAGAWPRCQARHRWHTPPPSPRNSGLPARPQTAHAGMARAAEPRAISSAASRPATGGAPAAQRCGIGGQRVRELPQGLPARGDRIDRGLDHRRGQRRVRRRHRRDYLLPAAARARPAAQRPGQLVP